MIFINMYEACIKAEWIDLIPSFQSEWKLQLTKEIRQMGFSTNVLLAVGHVGAKAALKQRTWDIELQEHISKANTAVSYTHLTLPTKA